MKPDAFKTMVGNFKESLSQIMASFAVLSFFGGVFIMSPSGRFFSFLIMAITSAIPMMLGSKKLRILGVIGFIVGIVGTMMFFEKFNNDPYFIRHRYEKRINNP